MSGERWLADILIVSDSDGRCRCGLSHLRSERMQNEVVVTQVTDRFDNRDKRLFQSPDEFSLGIAAKGNANCRVVEVIVVEEEMENLIDARYHPFLLLDAPLRPWIMSLKLRKVGLQVATHSRLR